MDKQKYVEICDSMVKLVRAEHSLSQDKMALMLGISKKTLVEIEKGRSSLGWTGSVALSSIFINSEVIAQAFGGRPSDIILAIAWNGSEQAFPHSTSNHVWWSTVMKNERYVIQQNILSQHFRLLTIDGERVISSFVLEDLAKRFNECEPEGSPINHEEE